MRLLNKSTFYLILFLVPVFVIGGFVLFGIISKQITDNADESLLAQKKVIIENFITSDSTELHYFNDADDDVKIRLLKNGFSNANIFTDTMIFDSTEMELIPFRQLASDFSKDNKFYEIVVTRSNFKSDELAESISIALVFMFGLILLSVVFINRFISGKIFIPFNQTLEALNNISFADNEPHSFNQTSTVEFNELNRALNRMTEKMFKDFNNQKQFTENASHELQTPLAVIKARIDVLIQDNDLSEESMEQILEIDKAVNKLSHLNKSLLLLSKIENRQFDDSVEIQLTHLTDKIFSSFDDDICNKNILLEKDYLSKPTVKMNSLLAEILFANLIQNAIRHNLEEGILRAETGKNYFLLSNSGASLKGKEETLFNRFTKYNPAVESVGLGLSIVNQICNYYDFSINYFQKDGLHFFKVTLNKEST